MMTNEERREFVGPRQGGQADQNPRKEPQREESPFEDEEDFDEEDDDTIEDEE